MFHNAWLAQLVEQDVANVQVAGSNPVPRTNFEVSHKGDADANKADEARSSE